MVNKFLRARNLLGTGTQFISIRGVYYLWWVFRRRGGEMTDLQGGKVAVQTNLYLIFTVVQVSSLISSLNYTIHCRHSSWFLYGRTCSICCCMSQHMRLADAYKHPLDSGLILTFFDWNIWIKYNLYELLRVDNLQIPYVGKIWRRKILANLANGVQFAKIFHANSYRYSEITEDLPADSPKFSPSKIFPRTVMHKPTKLYTQINICTHLLG